MDRLILITGGAGFLGSHVSRLLAGRGHRVRILDDLSIGRLEYADGIRREIVRAPLADADAVRSAVDGVDSVVHLAARAGIPDSVADPIGTFAVNVDQTLRLLDAARVAGARRFVFASSNAATGEHEPPADETDLPHPLTPYGASKLAGEAYGQAYAATYGIAACSLRFSNAYGPYSLHKKSVIAAWLRQALRGGPITIHGDGQQTRDFVYAEDLAAAVVAALDAGEDAISGEVFQAGTGVETTINELADALVAAVGRSIEMRHDAERAGDIRRNVSRIDKAARVLGYRPTVSLGEGLRRTAQWFEQALADPALSTVAPNASSGSE